MVANEDEGGTAVILISSVGILRIFLVMGNR